MGKPETAPAHAPVSAPTIPEAAPSSNENAPSKLPHPPNKISGRPDTPRPFTTPTSPLRGVPPFPGVSLVGLAKVPSPPCIDAESRPAERAQILVDVYRKAVAKKYGRDPRVFANGCLYKSKSFRPLVEAAELLVENEFAPAAWCLWKLDQWHHAAATEAAKKRPPPITWVFRAKTIAEQAAWFGAEESQFSGNAVESPKALDLARRYYAMRAEIDRLQAWRSPAEVVARHFPGDTWHRVVEEVRAEVRAISDRLAHEVSSGSFPW